MKSRLTPLFNFMRPTQKGTRATSPRKTNHYQQPSFAAFEKLEGRVLMSASVFDKLSAAVKAHSHKTTVTTTPKRTVSNQATLSTPVLNGTVISGTEIDLTWGTVANAQTYRVQRSTDGVTFSTVIDLTQPILAFHDITLTVGTNYYYQLVALDNSGNPSPASNIVNLTTLAAPSRVTGGIQGGTHPSGVPSVPVIAANGISANEIDITWPASSNSPTGYTIQRSIDGVNFSPLGSVTGSTLVYNDLTVSPGIPYYYEVVAINGSGGSAWSNIATAATATSSQGQPPGQTTLSATFVSANEVDLSWLAASNGPTMYVIQRGTNINYLVNQPYQTGTTLSYQDTSVVGGTTYYYHIGSFNSAGGAPWSNTLVITTPPAQVTAAPTTPVASLYVVSGSEIDVSWTNSLNNPEYYLVERATSPQGFLTNNFTTVSTDGHTTSYQDTNLQPGTKYYYRIVAGNTMGQSLPSLTVNAITNAGGTPDTPVISGYVISSSEIDVSWPATGIIPLNFTILRSADGGNTFVNIGTIPGTTDFYADTNLPAGVTNFFYQIIATDAAGNSLPSNIVQVTIPTGGSGMRPGPTNTGPTNPGILTHVGTLTITTPNTVLTNLYITGTLYIEAPGVIISNFIINANGDAYGIQVVNVSGGNNSVTATDGEVFNAMQGGIFGRNWTANRISFHDMGSDGTDGGGNNLLENCWIYNLGMTPGAHADGFQANNGTNIQIIGNYFDEPYGSSTYKYNSCIFLNEELGNQDPSDLYGTIISNNWFDGANYAIYAINQSGTVISNNIFGFDYQYGILYNPNGFPKPVWTGNVDTNGHPV